MFEEVKKGRFDDGIADAFQPMYDNMAEDISKQSKRLGGKMAVAQALYSRKQRDSMAHSGALGCELPRRPRRTCVD